MSKAKQLTTKYTDFIPENFSIVSPDNEENQLGENERSKGQRIGYPRYRNASGDDIRLFLQTPKMKLFSGGVPRIDAENGIASDNDRQFINVPFDLQNTESKMLYDKLCAIDSVYGSDDMKKRLFGKKASKYHHFPIVKHPEPDEKTGADRPPRMKLKFMTSYPDGEVQTQVFVTNSQGKREEQQLSTVTEFSELVRYQSENRYIINPAKMWAHTKPMGSTLGYGIIFKVVKVVTSPPEGSSQGLTQFYTADAFIDSDEEEEETHGGTTVQQAATEDGSAANESSDESDSEESSDESESDEQPIPAPKKQNKKKATAN